MCSFTFYKNTAVCFQSSFSWENRAICESASLPASSARSARRRQRDELHHCRGTRAVDPLHGVPVPERRGCYGNLAHEHPAKRVVNLVQANVYDAKRGLGSLGISTMAAQQLLLGAAAYINFNADAGIAKLRVGLRAEMDTAEDAEELLVAIGAVLPGVTKKHPSRQGDGALYEVKSLLVCADTGDLHTGTRAWCDRQLLLVRA
jgi:hypothetical protein